MLSVLQVRGICYLKLELPSFILIVGDEGFKLDLGFHIHALLLNFVGVQFKLKGCSLGSRKEEQGHGKGYQTGQA